MNRTACTALLLCLAAFAAAPDARAQTMGTEAYAPDDLRQLSVPDRARVIEKEYAEQSRGRRVPDDQLEFYLDQVQHSDWTFSRIKQDIATSLGDDRRAGWRPPPSGWQPRSMICSSENERYRTCRTTWRGRSQLIDNISRTRCIEGANWGTGPGLIWVNRGCRGRFAEGGEWRPGEDWRNRYNVTCSSLDGRYTTCAWNGRYGQPVLIQQLSHSACTEGVTWGHYGNAIWVNGGCRARFGATGR